MLRIVFAMTLVVATALSVSAGDRNKKRVNLNSLKTRAGGAIISSTVGTIILDRMNGGQLCKTKKCKLIPWAFRPVIAHSD